MLGQTKIDAVVLDRDKDEARLCEIAENLFRDELSVLDRSEQIAEWLNNWRHKGAHREHPGGKQPGDRGISKAAKKLKLSRAMIGRAEKIAGIPEDVKAVAKEAKLGNSTRELLKIAKEKTPEAQLQKIEEFRDRSLSKKQRKATKKRSTRRRFKFGGDELPELDAPSLSDNDDEEQCVLLGSLDPPYDSGYEANGSGIVSCQPVVASCDPARYPSVASLMACTN